MRSLAEVAATFQDHAPSYIGAVETAAEFFCCRAGDAWLEELHAVLASVPDRPPDPGDELPPGL